VHSATAPAALVRGPFTTTQARTCGVSESALRSAVWRQVLRGVWVHHSVPDSRQLRLGAVRLVLPAHATACGLAAAWLHGADVRREDDLDVEVSCPEGHRIRSRPGLRVRQEMLAPGDITTIDGLPVTTALRTAFDCARWLRGVERVVVVDALCHAGLTSIDEIRGYIASKYRLRNLRVALAVLDLADPLAESAMETRVRVCIVEAGLPKPVSQHILADASGGFVARLDLSYPELRLAIEYDGAWHWSQRRADDRRRTRARELGWTVLVYSAEDYYRSRDAMLAEIARHIRIAEAR
jgi:hypothetical protein